MAETLARVGDKWTVLVVGALSLGSLRYNEIYRLVSGISQRMLTMTLRSLEQDGLVNRTMHPTIPPRVDYELTGLGMSLTQPLQVLYNWAVSHREEMDAARQRFAQARSAAGD